MPVRPWGISGFGAEEQAAAFPAGAPAQARRTLAPTANRSSGSSRQVVSRGTGRRGAARRLRGGQDRHQPEPPRRLVHRLQRSARRRRLGRQRRRHAMDAVTGGSLPALIWKEFLTKAAPVPWRAPRPQWRRKRRPSIRRKPARSASMRRAISPRRRPKSPAAAATRSPVPQSTGPSACPTARISLTTAVRAASARGLATGDASPLSIAKGYGDEPPPSGRLADVDGPTPPRQAVRRCLRSCQQSNPEQKSLVAEYTCAFLGQTMAVRGDVQDSRGGAMLQRRLPRSCRALDRTYQPYGGGPDCGTFSTPCSIGCPGHARLSPGRPAYGTTEWSRGSEAVART